MNLINCRIGKINCVVYSMTNDKGIFIKNIYYMLAYAFQNLELLKYESIKGEEFDDIQDLFAAILAKGAAKRIKHGLYREYVGRHETLAVMRGKLDIPETINNRRHVKQNLVCEFDELSENNLFNQILKTTMNYLIKDRGVAAERKAALNKMMIFFDGVLLLKPSDIEWSGLHYQRINKNYEMLMNICYFVLDGMLQTTESGEYKLAEFSDKHMGRLFEKFILEYYRRKHNYLSDVRAAQVKWDLRGDNNRDMIRFLPVMQTDIFLKLNEKVLILDTKYYGRTFQKRFDKATLHSGNMYQMFTYVKNQDKYNTGNVSGMILYAKTEEEVTPNCVFNIGGNLIGAKTIDLNKSFESITMQLDDIVSQFL